MSDQPTALSSDEDESGSRLEQRIRERAYYLWELEGRQDGKAEEYWHRAAEQIRSDTQASYPPAASRRHRN
jgi:DUF2934 family protein